MPHIPYVTSDEASGSGQYDKRSLYTEVWMHNPAVVAAQTEYHGALMDAGVVDQDLYELVMVTVARANECAYCASSHRENLVKMQGLPRETVAALREGKFDDLDEFERTVVEFADRVARDPHRVTESHVQSLRDVGFTNGDVVQLLAVIGACSTANTINSALSVEPSDRDDELPTF